MTRKCNRCDTKVSYVDVSPGYAAVCTNHDEDVYLIETYLEENQMTNSEMVELTNTTPEQVMEDLTSSK